jgi:hypothetical protein
MEAEMNTSIVALRVVGGDAKITHALGFISGPSCSWGYGYGDLDHQVGGVSNLRQ